MTGGRIKVRGGMTRLTRFFLRIVVENVPPTQAISLAGFSGIRGLDSTFGWLSSVRQTPPSTLLALPCCASRFPPVHSSEAGLSVWRCFCCVVARVVCLACWFARVPFPAWVHVVNGKEGSRRGGSAGAVRYHRRTSRTGRLVLFFLSRGDTQERVHVSW